jgi:hypothetical protein
MAAIKIHLEAAESDAVERLATRMGVKPEAVAYTALNRLMLATRDPGLGTEVRDTWEGKKHNLPLWADSAWSVHAYEGKADDEPEPSKYVGGEKGPSG